jgi:hypothetical protein
MLGSTPATGSVPRPSMRVPLAVPSTVTGLMSPLDVMSNIDEIVDVLDGICLG